MKELICYMLYNKTKRKTILFLVAFIVLSFICIALSSDIIGVQMYGISYFMNNTDTKYNHKVIQDTNSYSIQIDLDNLDNNAENVLYNENGLLIKIERVYKSNISKEVGDQYIVQFRSIPKYSVTNGEFISFFNNNYGNSREIGYDNIKAICTVQYNGKEYDSQIVSGENADQLVGCALFNYKAIQEGTLGQHRTIANAQCNITINSTKWRASVENLPRRQTDSSRQAALVSQIQICQCKHHMQFCRLLSQTSVSRFPIPKYAFDHAKNMLHFCPY